MRRVRCQSNSGVLWSVRGGLPIKNEISKFYTLIIFTLALTFPVTLTACAPTQNPVNEPAGGYEFSVKDIFIKRHELLSEECFWRVDIKELHTEDLEVSKSEERANGPYLFWAGEGIIYVTNTSAGIYPLGVILTNDKYSLGCGLKVGMTVEEMKDLEIPLRQYVEGEVYLGNIMRTTKGPLAELDYDAIYYYFGEISPEEVEEYQVDTSTCRGINVLMKDEKIAAICLDFPTAG